MEKFSLKYLSAFPVLVYLGFLLSVSACSSLQVGKDFNISTFTQNVKTGISTKAQVRSWLGEPVSSGISVDKEGIPSEQWMYFYGSGNLPKMDDTKIKVLQIRFDKNGRISTYNWSKSAK